MNNEPRFQTISNAFSVKKMTNYQVPSWWSATGTYAYLGRYQLNYCVSRKKLQDPNALITDCEYNYMQCLLEGCVYFVLLHIYGRHLLEGGVYWNKYVMYEQARLRG